MPFSPRVLSDEELQALGLTATQIADCVAGAVRAKAEGRLHTTPKSVILPGDGRYLMSTLATGGTPDVTVLKAVTVCPDNPEHGLPSITGAIMVLDAHRGTLLAVMDSGWITAMRTAALSAVAARQMAQPDSRIMSFVGAGVQARSHLEMFAQLFPLKAIRIHGRGQANIDTLSAMARDMGLDAQVCDRPEQALEDADIVVSSITITYSGDPFLDARLMKPGAFASVTDAAKPWISESLDAFETVVVDDMEQELSNARPMVPADRIATDLTGLLSDSPEIAPGPRAFMFRGIAVGDHALAARAWAEVVWQGNK